MKAKSILSAFIGTFLFAGISSAQHVKAFSGVSFNEGAIVKTLGLDIQAVDQRSGRQKGRNLTYTLEVRNVGSALEVNSPTDTIFALEFLDATSRGDSGDIDTMVISYSGLEDRNLQLFEAVIPASTREGCLASRDFSAAVPVGPDRARSTYDPDTGTNTMVWNNLRNLGTPSCRVLIVRNSVNVSDLNVWRANYGRQ